MKGIHLALIPAVTLASGTIRWEKVNHCLDRDVLSNQLQDLLQEFIESTGDTCDDSCLSGFDCITCLQDSMINFMTEEMYSVLCESGNYLKKPELCESFNHARKIAKKFGKCLAKGKLELVARVDGSGKGDRSQRRLDLATSDNENDDLGRREIEAVHPMASFAPMGIVLGARNDDDQTDDQLFPSVDSLEPFSLHTCLGINRPALMQFIHTNYWFQSNLVKCGMCLQDGKSKSCSFCWRKQFNEPNDAYATYCGLPNTDCVKIKERKFLGQLKRCITKLGQIKA